MRGRFEKPRQSRFSKPQPPERPQRPNSANDPGRYPPQGYYQNQPGYGEDNGSYGYETGCNSEYPGYSDPGYTDPRSAYPGGYQGGGWGNPPRPPQPPRKGGFGWAVLGFFLPLVGLILCLSWKRSRPGDARSAGKGALIGFITGLVALILTVCIAFFAGKSFMNGMLDKVNKVEVNVEYTEDTVDPTETEYIVEAETTAPETEPVHVASPDDYINFLVVGQAAREGEQERFADSAILCTVNTYDKTMTMTSLLRDAFVSPPPYQGHTFGRIKLTTVYHLGYLYAGNSIAGSMELMDMTLFKNFGIEVDHNFEIDFQLFETIINKLGGIDVVLDEAEAKYLTKVASEADWFEYHFEPGDAHLDGYIALLYARMRKADGDGDSDIKRTARQQKVVQSIVASLRTKSVAEIQSIASDVLPLISTSMSNEQMMDTMKLLIPMLPELKILPGGTCPVNYKGEMVDIYDDGMKHSVLRFNENETKEIMRERTLGIKPGTEPAQ